MKEVVLDIQKHKLVIEIEEVNTDEDHMHMLVSILGGRRNMVDRILCFNCRDNGRGNKKIQYKGRKNSGQAKL